MPNVTSRNVFQRPLLLLLLVLLLLTATAFFLVASSPPAIDRPDVGVTLIGYTNEISGDRLAIFEVTNRSSRMIHAYLPTVQIQSASEPLGFTNYFHGGTNQWRRLHSRMRRGESVQFKILAPPAANSSPWRVTLNVYADFDLVQRLRRSVLGRRNHPFYFHSDWIPARERNSSIPSIMIPFTLSPHRTFYHAVPNPSQDSPPRLDWPFRLRYSIEAFLSARINSSGSTLNCDRISSTSREQS